MLHLDLQNLVLKLTSSLPLEAFNRDAILTTFLHAVIARQCTHKLPSYLDESEHFRRRIEREVSSLRDGLGLKNKPEREPRKNERPIRPRETHRDVPWNRKRQHCFETATQRKLGCTIVRWRHARRIFFSSQLEHSFMARAKIRN